MSLLLLSTFPAHNSNFQTPLLFYFQQLSVNPTSTDPDAVTRGHVIAASDGKGAPRGALPFPGVGGVGKPDGKILEGARQELGSNCPNTIEGYDPIIQVAAYIFIIYVLYKLVSKVIVLIRKVRTTLEK